MVPKKTQNINAGKTTKKLYKTKSKKNPLILSI
jgi:hypothetical protein